MQDVELRRAEVDDLPALRALFRRSSLHNEGDRELLGRHPEFLEWAGDDLAEGRTRVAVLAGTVVGFSTVEPRPPVGEVEDFFVDPDWMRRGIGRRLAEDMAAEASAAGWSALEVDANPAAVAFYERVGFVGLGPVALEHGTALRMRLVLGSLPGAG